MRIFLQVIQVIQVGATTTGLHPTYALYICIYIYAAHNGRRQVVFLMCHCGPMFPRNDAAGGPGGVIPEVLNDSEWLQRQLLTCRRIPNDTSTKIVRKLLRILSSEILSALLHWSTALRIRS